MGANAQTSVPAFTSGQVLTAAQVTQINTGIPVFASSTERDAAFGGTGEKTLAEGQMAYLEDTNETQYYDGSSWAAVGAASGGLVYITKTTLSGASVSFDNVFDSTYENYLIVISNVTATVSVPSMTFKLRASSTDSSTSYYYHQAEGLYSSSSYGGRNGSNATSVLINANVQTTSTAPGATSMTVFQPALTQYTGFNYEGYEAAVGRNIVKGGGYHAQATAYDGFTLAVTANAFQSGTCFVYGLATS